MADENTDEMNGKRPFEDRVFARFDAVAERLNGVDARFDAFDSRFDLVDSSISNLDSRLEKLESRAYDTKPLWAQVLKEIVNTRRELSQRLDRIVVIAFETRSGLRDVENRLGKIENKLTQ